MRRLQRLSAASAASVVRRRPADTSPHRSARHVADIDVDAANSISSSTRTPLSLRRDWRAERVWWHLLVRCSAASRVVCCGWQPRLLQQLLLTTRPLRRYCVMSHVRVIDRVWFSRVITLSAAQNQHKIISHKLALQGGPKKLDHF